MQNNGCTLDFDLEQWNEAVREWGPYQLAGMTVEMVVKATDETDDDAGTTISATIESETTGRVSVGVSPALTAVYGNYWWRIDVIDGIGNPTTVMYGNLYVIPV